MVLLLGFGNKVLSELALRSKANGRRPRIPSFEKNLVQCGFATRAPNARRWASPADELSSLFVGQAMQATRWPDLWSLFGR